MSIVDTLAAAWTRKDFALVAAARHPRRGELFLRLDGKDCRRKLWQAVEPPRGGTE